MADVIDTLAIDIVANDSFTAIAKPLLSLLEQMEREFEKNTNVLGNTHKSVDELSEAISKLDDKTHAASDAQGKYADALKENEKQFKSNEAAAKNLIDGVVDFGKALSSVRTMILSGIGLEQLAKESSQANQELDNIAKNIGENAQPLDKSVEIDIVANDQFSSEAQRISNLDKSVEIDIVANDGLTSVAERLIPLLERMEVAIDGNTKSLGELHQREQDLIDGLEDLTYVIDENTDASSDNEKQLKKNEKAAKNLLDGILGFGKALGAISTMIMAGIGLDRLVKQASHANQELDSMAKNIGMSSRSLATWKGAAEAMGGSASGMANTLSSLSGALTRFQVMGDASVIPFFNALGVAPLDAMGNIRKLEDIMLELADKFSKMDRGTALVMAQGLGIDEETFNTLAQGKEAYQEMLDYQGKVYKSNQDDIETSKKLNKSVSMLNQQFDGLKLMIANAAAPALLTISELTTKFFEFLSRNENLVKGVFMGIAGAMSVVLIPTLLSGAKAALGFIAPFLPAILLVATLAGAFGLLYEDYHKWAEGGNSLFNWGAFIKWFDKANFSAGSLLGGLVKLLTGYSKLSDALSDAKAWATNMGFFEKGKVTMNSFVEGIKNVGKAIWDYIIEGFKKVGELIDAIMEGEWDKVASISWDLFTGYTPKGFILGKVIENVTDEENVAQAMDIAGNTTGTDVSMEKVFTDGKFSDSKNGFSKAGTEVEKSIRNEMNRLGYSKQEQAMFLATVTHESNDFKKLREIGGYRSVEQMQKAGIARAKRDPEGAKRAIEQGIDAQFEFMYGGRMGNDQVGDGAKYRGRGAIQVTGKDNYRRIGKMLGVDLVNNPELLEKDPVLAAKASIAWWENQKSENKSFRQAISTGDFKTVTKFVNNGDTGWEDRQKRYAMYSRDVIPSKTIDPNQPLGGYAVATALNATQQARQTMQNLAQPQSINNNQRTEVVINGGINVHSSASTITGTTQDAANGIKTSMSGLQFNYGLS